MNIEQFYSSKMKVIFNIDLNKRSRREEEEKKEFIVFNSLLKQQGVKIDLFTSNLSTCICSKIKRIHVHISPLAKDTSHTSLSFTDECVTHNNRVNADQALKWSFSKAILLTIDEETWMLLRMSSTTLKYFLLPDILLEKKKNRKWWAKLDTHIHLFFLRKKEKKRRRMSFLLWNLLATKKWIKDIKKAHLLSIDNQMRSISSGWVKVDIRSRYNAKKKKTRRIEMHKVFCHPMLISSTRNLLEN